MAAASDVWFADNIVPVFHGDLACDDRGRAAVAIVEDFQEVATLGCIEDRQALVVEDKELNASERLEQAAIATIATR